MGKEILIPVTAFLVTIPDTTQVRLYWHNFCLLGIYYQWQTKIMEQNYESTASLVSQGFSDYCHFPEPIPASFSRSKKSVFPSDTPWPASEYSNILEEFHPVLNEEILMWNWRPLNLSRHLKRTLKAMKEAKWPGCPSWCFLWGETGKGKTGKGNYQIFPFGN